MDFNALNTQKYQIQAGAGITIPTQIASQPMTGIPQIPVPTYGWQVPNSAQIAGGATPGFKHTAGETPKCSMHKDLYNNAMNNAFNLQATSAVESVVETLRLGVEIKTHMIGVHNNCPP